MNIVDAKSPLSLLIKAAQAGEEVVIANRGEPLVRLVPARAPSAKANTGSARAILDWLKGHPLPAYTRRPTAEVDASVEEQRNSWDWRTPHTVWRAIF